MSKKSKQKEQEPQTGHGRALRELTNMKHKDLQIACILRGLPSADVVGFAHPKLVEWFVSNYDNGQDPDLLRQHDDWVEEQLKARGHKVGDVLLSPALRLGFVGDVEKMEKPNSPKPKNAELSVTPHKKPKAVVDEKTGVRSGTKKSLTYKLTTDGVPLEDIILAVKKAFPGAEEKSIKIWRKRCLKQLEDSK